MANPQAIKVAAPFITLGATWAARKGLEFGYRAITGAPPPQASNREAPLRNAIVWALSTAVAVAMVNLVIERYLVGDDGVDDSLMLTTTDMAD